MKEAPGTASQTELAGDRPPLRSLDEGSSPSAPAEPPEDHRPAIPWDYVTPEDVARLIQDRSQYYFSLFRLWEQHGFHLMPVHFYSPIPNVGALKDDLWHRPSELVGIDMRDEIQMAFLREVCPSFCAEYELFPSSATDVPWQYHSGQMMFRTVDAEVLHCMVRHLRPRRIVEVGSGFSSYVTAAAGLLNAEEGSPVEFTAIEPHPNETLAKGIPGLSRLISHPVQDVGGELFDQLGPNDILFIDSSHVLRIDSDVRFLLLEVLPRLNPGVVVHVHDIFLPHEYPETWVSEEFRFWSEQYLLQAFLAFNSAFEVIWAGSYMAGKHADALREAFSRFDPADSWPGSFWIRRVAGRS